MGCIWNAAVITLGSGASAGAAASSTADVLVPGFSIGIMPLMPANSNVGTE
jgi:hypothetical protein